MDDGEPSQWALDEAILLADGLDARVSLLHVVGNPVGMVMAPEIAFDSATRCALVDAGRALVEEVSGLVPRELLGERIIRQGLPADEIVCVAQETHPDLIVIGTHGRGPLGRFLLGSVAESVVRRAPCPVLTVAHARKGRSPEPCVAQPEAVAPSPVKSV